jgi:hypothetical protein
MEAYGGWFACEWCGELIDRGSIDALAHRSFTLGQSGTGEGRSLEYYQALFTTFFQYRTEPRRSESMEDV